MQKKMTFYKRAFRRFVQQATESNKRGMKRFRRSHDRVRDLNEEIAEWVTDHRKPIIVTIGIIVFTIVTVLFIIDVVKGKMTDPTKTGIGGIIGAPLVGGLVGGIGALGIYTSLWLIDRILLVLIYVTLLTPTVLKGILYAGYLILLVLAQFLLLLPLTLFVLGNNLRLLWRRIFYTCPNRECTFRGLPTHLCPKCGQDHNDLVPNKYGLFYHVCGCGRKLPTFDFTGRKTLERRCSKCQIVLSGGIGQYPEELVALIGGPSVGKTVFLLASTRELISGKVKITRNGNNSVIQANIAVPAQEKDLKTKLHAMDTGFPPDKTSVRQKTAYLLKLNRKNKASLLYYYDAAGEAFSKIVQAGKLQHLKHLDGILLLVDPFSLPNLKHRQDLRDKNIDASDTSFVRIVATLMKGIEDFRDKREQKCKIPLAVVITKADIPAVRNELGDVKAKMPTSEMCQVALVNWGAGGEVRKLQQNFSTIHFFACSALGRVPLEGDVRPFKGYRTVEPLQWILNK